MTGTGQKTQRGRLVTTAFFIPHMTHIRIALTLSSRTESTHLHQTLFPGKSSASTSGESESSVPSEDLSSPVRINALQDPLSGCGPGSFHVSVDHIYLVAASSTHISKSLLQPYFNLRRHPELACSLLLISMERKLRPRPRTNLEKCLPEQTIAIKSTDMAEEMQQDAIVAAQYAIQKFQIEKDIASYLKMEFDRKYGPSWHCVVGRNFGSYVTHETNHFIYFYIKHIAVMLFKTGF
ncbi:unnamed protein product [Cylicocyclus nassatus]|uniref:Dynein light chain n=1 Tax=Cylicocyclus nassatus TaxID=53992 RepID=A0AA36MGC6_CYLNA|nr:unnamed protein product [Cylicocyclus nassatus]